MELKEAIKKLNEEKIVVDGKDIDDTRFFLFGRNNVIYYIHDFTINEDKVRLAIKNNQRPCFLAENWWNNKWEVYEEDDNKFVEDKLKRIKAILEEDFLEED